MSSRSRAGVLVAFGTAVRRLRVARGWSQEEFADRVGMHRTYIGSIERGEQNVCLVNISKIAIALGMPISSVILSAEQEGRSG